MSCGEHRTGGQRPMLARMVALPDMYRSAKRDAAGWPAGAETLAAKPQLCVPTIAAEVVPLR